MKNLVMAVFAVILMVLPISANYAESKTDESQTVMPVPLESNADLNLRPIKEMTPIYRTPGRGDRLWDYVIQYNLGYPKEIVEFNKGKVGEKCIKNENLILRGCEIAIPAYTLIYVRIHDAVNEKVLERVKDVARDESVAKSGKIIPFLALAFLVSFTLFVVAFVSRVYMKKRVMDAENKAADLSSKLWVAEDKVKNLEMQKESLITEWGYVHTELVDTRVRVAEFRQEIYNLRLDIRSLLAKLALATSVARFITQSGKMIEFDVAKVRCRLKDCDTEVSPKNALSHHFQQHPQTEEEPASLKETVDRT